MAEEFFAIEGDPLAAVFPAVRPEPRLLRHTARMRAWIRNIGDCQQDMLFVLQRQRFERPQEPVFEYRFSVLGHNSILPR